MKFVTNPRTPISFLWLGVAPPALAAALLSPPAAWAADTVGASPASPVAEDSGEGGGEGEPIIVTARHREEKAQDVPVAISVVSGASLERNGNYTIGQIQQTVPSLQVAAMNPRNSNINIRGLGANSSIAVDGLEYGVGFYVDGVYFARPGQSQFDLVDIERIEVLRGPQGTLFGKNTTAGAINITTREPSFTPELTAEVSAGNYDYHQIRIAGSLPLVDDKVALALSVADTDRDGFLTNSYDGSKAEDYHNFSARGQLLIKPTDTLKIRLIGDYASQQQHYALNLIDGYFATYEDGVAIPNNIYDRTARNGYALPTDNAFTRVGAADSPFQANMKSYGVSGEVDWDLGHATLTSITAYRWWDWYPKNDTDSTSLAINTKSQQGNLQRQFSEELRIASNGRNTIDYQAGLFYFWQVVRGFGTVAYGKDFAAWNLNPATVSAQTIALTDIALNGYEADSYSDPTTKSLAAFGQADWHITDRLTLTAGLRFTHEDKHGSFSRYGLAESGTDLSTLTADEQAAIAAIRNVPAYVASNLSFSASLKSNALSGLVTLSYKIIPDVLAYVSYSHGSKSGGLNVTAGGVIEPVVAPEKVDAWELGVKSQALDGRLTANIVAFRTDVHDFQANITLPIAGTTTGLQYIANIPLVRSQGFEADLAYVPVHWLSLTGSLAYTDAKYVSYADAPQAPERLDQGAGQDMSGEPLSGVSKVAWTLGGDVTRPLSEHSEIYLHADWLHRSSFNSSAANSIYSQIPGYGVLNAKLGLSFAEGRYDLSVWARNLFDQNYYVARTASTFGLVTAIVGDPRTFGATLRVKL